MERPESSLFEHILLDLLGEKPYNKKLAEMVILFEKISVKEVSKQDPEVFETIKKIKEDLAGAVTSPSAKGILADLTGNLEASINDDNKEEVLRYQSFVTHALMEYTRNYFSCPA